MRIQDIDAIVIHCSATREGLNFKASDIERWHRERGMASIGYHFIIDLDGTVETGRPLPQNGAHCNTSGVSGSSYNKHSIGICYVGGVSKDGVTSKDTRTPEQKAAMYRLVHELMVKYPSIVDILGHRDASPDANKDGRITRNEWTKQCPCFEVRAEFPVALCRAGLKK